MQREILRRNWKRFLIQLQKSSDAVSDSPAGMFFSRPYDLRWQLAYIQTGRSQRQQGERLTTERLTRTSKGLAFDLAGPSDVS